MFSSLGLFKHTPCPRQIDCGLPSCIFSHDTPEIHSKPGETHGSTAEYDPFSAGGASPPPPKRRRLASPMLESKKDDILDLKLPESISHEPSKDEKPPSASTKGVKRSTAQDQTPPPRPPFKAQVLRNDPPVSTARTVSPPPARRSKPSPSPNEIKPARKVESLAPRTVGKAPAVHKTRMVVLQKLHEQMQIQNKKLAGMGDKRKSLVLDQQELISFALDEEEAATKLGDDIYKNTMAQSIQRVKKMTVDEWAKKVSEWVGRLGTTQAPTKLVGVTPNLLSTGLSSVDEQTAVLKHLRTPLEGLAAFGYVPKKPSASEIASAKAGMETSAGFESCDRCGTRFQVFPGRDQQGRLTSHGKCRYHWARPNRASRLRTDRILGQSEASYPCCNKMEGSEGCSEAETHVFNVKDPKRLAAILQFEHTPEKSDVRKRSPVSFDCEMGYTTLGTEIIRVTAVSWPEGRPLLDILVRPYGEILDLNTRYSGVTKEAYASAAPYDAATSEDLQQCKVDSPSAARQLLFEHLSHETPLIGHAIENDLNACRIIHPFVIDTVLLYPHPRGLPFRHGLKMLSQKYLFRGIQLGGDAGHDSKEDAVATGDLVTVRVGEKWRVMQHEGWKFVDGILMAPEEFEKVGGGGQSML